MHDAPESPRQRSRLLAHLGREPRRVQRLPDATPLVRTLLLLLLVAYGATILTLALAVASIITPDTVPSWWAVAAALLLVGLSMMPTSRWLHHALDQLIVGWPDDPYAALSRVQAELLADPSPQAIVPAVAASITATLRLPYAAITSASDGVTVSVGTAPAGAERVSFPLRYAQTAVGTLEVTARRPGTRLSVGELHLLADLARQVGITLHAAQLSDALQVSRTQLVAAREEERRRIRRDLHDDLGPTLAAMRLQLGAARRTLRTEPDVADALLAELRTEVVEATAAIRRLVYDLRPPLLDEHGLAGALQSLGRLIEPQPLRLQLPERLPALPAAVEVALYRIAAEALHNAARHAPAAGCTVSLEIADEAVELRVADTGPGLPSGHRDGVGLAAMRERAEELGGSLHVESQPAVGVSVVARLPWRLRS